MSGLHFSVDGDPDELRNSEGASMDIICTIPYPYPISINIYGYEEWFGTKNSYLYPLKSEMYMDQMKNRYGQKLDMNTKT